MSLALPTVDEAVDLIYTEYYSMLTNATGEEAVRAFVTDALNGAFRYAEWAEGLDIHFMLKVADGYAQALKDAGAWATVWSIPPQRH